MPVEIGGQLVNGVSKGGGGGNETDQARRWSGFAQCWRFVRVVGVAEIYVARRRKEVRRLRRCISGFRESSETIYRNPYTPWAFPPRPNPNISER